MKKKWAHDGKWRGRRGESAAAVNPAVDVDTLLALNDDEYW